MPILQCLCLEAPGARGLGKAAEHESACGTRKPFQGSPAECVEAAECSSLVSGRQSQKADVPLCSFLSLAPGPLAGFKQLLASLEQLGSRAASFAHTMPV